VWAVKSLSSMGSASRAGAGGQMDEMWWSVELGGALRDRRNSNQCDSETQESTHMSSVGGRKESI
jgi:hypothetical protein